MTGKMLAYSIHSCTQHAVHAGISQGRDHIRTGVVGAVAYHATDAVRQIQSEATGTRFSM